MDSLLALPRLGLLLAALALAATCSAEGPAPLARASLTIHADRPIRVIPREIFGYNLEWIYDGSGLWDAKTHALYPDRRKLIAALGPGSFRYPGGTLSDYFHWHQAIGADRKPQLNPFIKPGSGQPQYQYPAYGPAEFLATCKAFSAVPWITCNAGTGTPGEAAAWARWCRAQGEEVTHWEVGNELYLKPDDPSQVGFTPDHYVKTFRAFARALRAVNPHYTICAIGAMPAEGIMEGSLPHTDWNHVVLAGCAKDMDCIALHNAYAPVVSVGSDGKQRPLADVYRAMLGASLAVRWSTEQVLKLIRAAAPARADHISVAITEHEGLWYPFGGADATETVRQNRTLGSAIYLATLYNYFVSEPKIAFADKMTLITPIFGGVLNTTLQPGGKVWPNPQYYVCRAYGRLAGQTALTCDVRAPVYSTTAVGFVPALPAVPYLDAAAAMGKGGAMTALLVNRSLSQTLPVSVNLPGRRVTKVEATVITGPRYDCTNDAPDEPAVKPAAERVKLATPLGVDLPPCSLTVLHIDTG